MGRGLSDLQQFILRETAKHGVLFREEIKERFFHLLPRKAKSGHFHFYHSGTRPRVPPRGRDSWV